MTAESLPRWSQRGNGTCRPRATLTKAAGPLGWSEGLRTPSERRLGKPRRDPCLCASTDREHGGTQAVSRRTGSPREARSEGPKVLFQQNRQPVEFSADEGCFPSRLHLRLNMEHLKPINAGSGSYWPTTSVTCSFSLIRVPKEGSCRTTRRGRPVKSW